MSPFFFIKAFYQILAVGIGFHVTSSISEVKAVFTTEKKSMVDECGAHVARPQSQIQALELSDA